MDDIKVSKNKKSNISEDVLVVNNIEVVYSHVILVLKGVSLKVKKGGITALLGGNGAGKSTTLKSISNLLASERGEVTKGSVTYSNEYIHDLDPSQLVKKGVIQVMEGRHCFEHLTVEENLRWMSPDNTSLDNIASALQAVGLRHYASIPCYRLSAGQHRRVALARLITSKASLWYLDEPFAALDKQGVAFIEACMQKHLDQGGAIVFSSHQDLVNIAARSYRLNPFRGVM